MDYTEATTEIIVTLIGKEGIVMSQFKECETYVDAVCEAYKKVYEVVSKRDE